MEEMPPEEEWVRYVGMSTNDQPSEGRELPHSMQFLIGLAIGLIPVLIVFVALNPALLGVPKSPGVYSRLNWVLAALLGALFAYAIEIGVMATLLSIKRVRFIGYGLLAMVFIAPVVTYIACTVPGMIRV